MLDIGLRLETWATWRNRITVEIIGDVAGGDVTSGRAVVYGVVVIDGGGGGGFVDGAFTED